MPWRPAAPNATRAAISAAPFPPPKEKHHATITEPKRVGELLRAIDSYEGFFATKGALRLAPLVFSENAVLAEDHR